MNGISAPVFSLANERQALHRHADARLILFTSGSQQEETFDGVQAFTAGDVLFRPSYFVHANATGAMGAVYVHVDVDAATTNAWLHRNGWRAGIARSPFTPAQLRTIAMRPRFGEALLEAVTVRARASTLPPEKRRLTASGRTPLAAAARQLGMAPYALSRTFRRRHGCTPRAYRNLARLHRAMAMLYEGALSLSEVAQACEYFDQSHFTRAIKRETGLTPAALSRAMHS